MAVRVRVVTGGEGLEVVKDAGTAEAVDLQHEGERLRTAAHPGVVRVLASGPTADGWELRVAHGGVPLRGERSTSTHALARVAADVAATLADLHERGVVHGRLDARRVLVGPTGALVCGFGPPAADERDAPQPSDDVAALGALVVEVLDRAGAAAPALRAIAERARAEPATRRPPMRRLADDLRRLAPLERVAERSSVSRSRAIAPAGLLAIGVAIAVVVIVVARWPQRSPARAAASVATSTAVPAHDRATTTSRLPDCVALAGSDTRVPICPRSVAIDANIVTVDGRRYVAGRPEDLVAVGDWDCDGEVTAALVRPSTGEVLVFSPFPVDRALSVTLAERVDGALELAIARGPDGCPELGVRDAAGARTVVGLPEPAP